MKFTANDYRQSYSGMSDLELLSLRRDELSEEARQCYDVEMAKRGIDAPADAAELLPYEVADSGEPAVPELADADAEQREEEELAPAGIFKRRGDAQAARTRLQSAFIPTFLEDDSLAAEWAGANPSGSFRLLVPASYLDKAREVLAAAS
jgi:Putative prokaryotic signal transducing protein